MDSMKITASLKASASSTMMAAGTDKNEKSLPHQQLCVRIHDCWWRRLKLLPILILVMVNQSRKKSICWLTLALVWMQANHLRYWKLANTGIRPWMRERGRYTVGERWWAVTPFPKVMFLYCTEQWCFSTLCVAPTHGAYAKMLPFFP